MFLDTHLYIQAHELAHVTVSKWILGSENWPNLEYSLEISHYTHLLVELRRLCEASLSIKVAEVEDIWASFRRPSD